RRRRPGHGSIRAGDGRRCNPRAAGPMGAPRRGRGCDRRSPVGTIPAGSCRPSCVRARAARSRAPRGVRMSAGAAAPTTRTIDVAEHFTHLGRSYDDYAFSAPGLGWVSRRELGIVAHALSDLAVGSRVLDAGAGNGRFVRLLVEDHGFDVTAVDM